MIDTSKALAIVQGKPSENPHPQLIAWLLQSGFVWERIVFAWGAGRCQAIDKNRQVEVALDSEYDQFLFAEADMIPRPLDTDPLFDGDYDLVCVRYNTESNHAWRDDGWHCGIWTAHRETLEGVGLPMFAWKTNGINTQVTGCTCSTLAGKARKLGYTLGVAGKAQHSEPVNGYKTLTIKTETP